MPQSTPKQSHPGDQAVGKQTYFLLASILQGKDRYHKKDPHSDAVRQAGESYGSREYVVAYESFKPVYDKVVADMQRVLARNPDFEANKLSHEQRKPLAAAKETVQRMRGHAQQVIDQFERLRKDLESKALVRAYIRQGSKPAADPPASVVEDAPPTTLNSASDTRLETQPLPAVEVAVGGDPYKRMPYAPPEIGSVYSVRDRVKGERIVRVIGKSPDGALIQVEVLKDGSPSKQPIELAVASLARQAESGWCYLLLPLDDKSQKMSRDAVGAPRDQVEVIAGGMMRLDIQNFSRCCGDIARANIKFDTQMIKDIGDGPFRAGKYEQAFLNFEQCAVGFNSAVGNSRRAIADGRRELNSEKGNLSGKEIQERTAAFVRNEHLIHTAEREFSTILEGLRMYLRAQPG